MTALLTVSGLTVRAAGRDLVHDVSFSVAPGARVGLIGESGSGKSLTALAVTGLLPPGLTATGSALLDPSAPAPDPAGEAGPADAAGPGNAADPADPADAASSADAAGMADVGDTPGPAHVAGRATAATAASGSATSGGTASGGTASGGTASGGTASGGTASGGEVSDRKASGHEDSGHEDSGYSGVDRTASGDMTRSRATSSDAATTGPVGRPQVIGAVSDGNPPQGVTDGRAAGFLAGRRGGRRVGAAIDMVTASERQRIRARGGVAAVVFQEPLTALDPLMRVGRQIAEPVRRWQRLRGAALDAAVTAALDEVRLPASVAASFPHQLSGGQRQRVAIAMALACRPRLLIADEPTTALDVTVQAEILDLLDSLVRARGMALLFITHDLPVAARIADQLLVLRDGRVVESGPAAAVIAAPAHEYTRALVDSARRFDAALDLRAAPAAADGGRAIDATAPRPGKGFFADDETRPGKGFLAHDAAGPGTAFRAYGTSNGPVGRVPDATVHTVEEDPRD